MLFTAVEMGVLFFIDDFWAYEFVLLPMLFSLGMIFTVGNTLAMNEGRTNAGGASALVGLSGYIFGATVAPLVGIGNILHSTAIVFGIMASMTLALAYATKRISPYPDMKKSPVFAHLFVQRVPVCSSGTRYRQLNTSTTNCSLWIKSKIS